MNVSNFATKIVLFCLSSKFSYKKPQRVKQVPVPVFWFHCAFGSYLPNNSWCVPRRTNLMTLASSSIQISRKSSST